MDQNRSTQKHQSVLKSCVDLLADLRVPQVKQLGCRSFSLLFDDIEREMCPADKRAFGSFAHAQVAVANAVYQHLGEPHTFLFCPTGKAASSGRPDNLFEAPPSKCPPAQMVSDSGQRGALSAHSSSPGGTCFHWGLMCVMLRSLQIIVLPSARPACPSRPTCRPWESSSCLGWTSCGPVPLQQHRRAPASSSSNASGPVQVPKWCPTRSLWSP